MSDDVPFANTLRQSIRETAQIVKPTKVGGYVTQQSDDFVREKANVDGFTTLSHQFSTLRIHFMRQLSANTKVTCSVRIHETTPTNNNKKDPRILN